MNRAPRLGATSLSLVACLALLAGCGVPGRVNPNNGRGGNGAPDLAGYAGNPDGGPIVDPDQIDPGVTPDNCTDGAKLIYVVDSNNVLSSFDATTLKFTDIGTLACPAQFGATPFSMAVDCNAQAWVLYSSGELFLVDTMNAKCKATRFVVGQLGYLNFGMGFATNAVGGADETLYISNAPDLFGGGGGLATLDTKTLKVKVIGPADGSPELTGTGDAKLWGFFPDTTKPRVAEIDKTDASEVKTFPLNTLAGQPSAWAFAHWGGDFWVFLKRIQDPSTSVHRLRPITRQLSTPIANTGRTIVGAGVSTCAPITIQ